jgi:phosphoribosylanthranilate isomerase
MKQSLQLKVCGMRESTNILEVASCQPDFIGFIFYAQSPRYVGTDFLIPSHFPNAIKRVGVFVNEGTQEIIHQHGKHQLDFIQLHGHESLNQVIELKERGCKIIKVFSMDDDFDFSITSEFEKNADYFLFDTKGKFYGGNAQRFNWQLLDQYTGAIPFLLSGGIRLEHMEEIMALNHPQLRGIDVNSGIELSPGVKDVNKVMAINTILKSKI